jgi:hypothetical protein
VAEEDLAEEEVKEQAHRGGPQGRAGTFGRGLSRPSRYLSPRHTRPSGCLTLSLVGCIVYVVSRGLPYVRRIRKNS